MSSYLKHLSTYWKMNNVCCLHNSMEKELRQDGNNAKITGGGSEKEKIMR